MTRDARRLPPPGETGLGERRPSVLIVGAGVAGLVAAMLLDRVGCDVTVLEASKDIGGRVRTSTALPSTEHAELGAMRIPATHALTRNLLRRLGLPTRAFGGEDAADLLFVGGVRVRRGEYWADPALLARGLDQEESSSTARVLLLRAMEPVVKRLRSAPDPEHAWASIESMSMRHYLHHVVGYSAAAVRLIEVVLDEASLLDAALAETVRTMAHAWSSETFLAVVTGFSSLPDRLARELSRPVFTEAHVVGLGQGLGGVTASVRVGKSDALQRVMADRVIVAVPAGLSRKIRFDPPLSPRKSRALRALRYHNAVKVFVQFREPFWLDDGLDGRIATTDLPNRFVFYPAGASRVVLASYTWGSDARQWSSLSSADRLDSAVAGLEAIHGRRLSDLVEDGITVDWGAEPFASGAYSCYAPGQGAAMRSALAAPEGRISFAGEHTSFKNGWIEGAVESGVRAAAEAVEQPAMGDLQ